MSPEVQAARAAYRATIPDKEYERLMQTSRLEIERSIALIERFKMIVPQYYYRALYALAAIERRKYG